MKWGTHKGSMVILHTYLFPLRKKSRLGEMFIYDFSSSYSCYFVCRFFGMEGTCLEGCWQKLTGGRGRISYLPHELLIM